MHRRLEGAVLTDPEPLPATVAYQPNGVAIGPDGRRLFFAAGMPDPDEGDGHWSAGENITPALNQGRDAFLRFPFMSADGRYFFFVHTSGNQFPSDDTRYYWVDAGVLPPRARRR